MFNNLYFYKYLLKQHLFKIFILNVLIIKFKSSLLDFFLFFLKNKNNKNNKNKNLKKKKNNNLNNNLKNKK